MNVQSNDVIASNVTLERMKMGTDSYYLCLIPPSPEGPAQPMEEQQEEITPVQSWALLKPLSGKCLYVRFHFPIGCCR
jgi:protein OS-9